MDEMTGEKIIIEMRSRFDGQLSWIIPELELLFKNQGGMVAGQSLRIGLNSRYGSGYASCIIHGSIESVSGPMRIPLNYQTLLRRFNGAKLFAVDLFGLLDERSNQKRCLSLEFANKFWITEYEKLSPRSFYFGSRTFSYSENIGYFYNESGHVYSARKSGEVLNVWLSIEEMLRDEWKVSKEIETETRERLTQAGQAS